MNTIINSSQFLPLLLTFFHLSAPPAHYHKSETATASHHLCSEASQAMDSHYRVLTKDHTIASRTWFGKYPN